MKIKNEIPNVNLSGKNIVITGATAGIGKETARSLAKMGGNIIFATRNKEKTLNTIAEIRKDVKNNSVILEHKYLDLMDLDSVRNYPSLLSGIDKIDILINNAGIGQQTGGKYFSHGLFRRGIYQKNSSPLTYNIELQEWLWKKSEELIGEEFIVERTKDNVLDYL